MAVTPRTLYLLRRLRIDIGTEVDATTHTLTTAWARAWRTLAGTWRAGIADAVATAATSGHWPAPWELARIERLMTALRAAEEALATLGQRTGVAVTDAAGTVIQATADAEPRLIASQLPAAEQAAVATRAANRILPSALDAIVARTQGQIEAATRPLGSTAVEAMRRALITGVAVGDNPRTVARQLLGRVEGAFNGGLTRAMVITRTEMLDAYRATSRYTHTANAGVVAGWVWVAALDRRTCAACWSRHGTEHPVDEPGPWDHQQGRCARSPLVRPWRDLGIKLPEPPSVLPDARARFDALPRSAQLAILGPQRLELLRTGRITWADLATQRANPGWRPSWVPTPVRDLDRVAA